MMFTAGLGFILETFSVFNAGFSGYLKLLNDYACFEFRLYLFE